MLALRKTLLAALLVAFVAVAMADTFVCPDGCESAATASAANSCNTSGACVFCTGGAVLHAAELLGGPCVSSLPSVERPAVTPRQSVISVPDQPPRLV